MKYYSQLSFSIKQQPIYPKYGHSLEVSSKQSSETCIALVLIIFSCFLGGQRGEEGEDTELQNQAHGQDCIITERKDTALLGKHLRLVEFMVFWRQQLKEKTTENNNNSKTTTTKTNKQTKKPHIATAIPLFANQARNCSLEARVTEAEITNCNHFNPY